MQNPLRNAGVRFGDCRRRRCWHVSIIFQINGAKNCTVPSVVSPNFFFASGSCSFFFFFIFHSFVLNFCHLASRCSFVFLNYSFSAIDAFSVPLFACRFLFIVSVCNACMIPWVLWPCAIFGSDRYICMYRRCPGLAQLVVGGVH